MKKRDFVQQTSAQFIPQLDWDIDKSIRYAEKLWHRLGERGYGDSKPAENKMIEDAYQKLTHKQKIQFDLFWRAFDYKHAKQRAAMRWLSMGELKEADFKQLIQAASRTAEARKGLPEGQVPKMAEGWLSERRYEDFAETETDKKNKKDNHKAVRLREIAGDLNHAKRLADTTDDEFWSGEVERLTELLREAREND